MQAKSSARANDVALTALPGMSFLQSNAVAPSTLKTYKARVTDFEKFAKENLFWPMKLAADLDGPLSEFLTLRYLLGYAAADGNKTVAAVLFFRQGIRLRDLPRCRQSLQGWMRVDPPMSLVPPPWTVVSAFAVQMERALKGAGLAVVMAHDAYLRPGELLGLHCQDVLPPSPPDHPHWSIIVRAREWETPSKTGDFDDTIPLDRVETKALFAEMLPMLLRGRLPQELLWKFSYREFLTAFNNAGDLLALNKTFRPYSLRHSGPSHDRLTKERSIAAVARRGRWLCETTARRYDKNGKTQQVWLSLSQKLQHYCLHLRQNLKEFLMSPKAAILPPRRSVFKPKSGKRAGF
jgi:hypothetical protein